MRNIDKMFLCNLSVCPVYIGRIKYFLANIFFSNLSGFYDVSLSLSSFYKYNYDLLTKFSYRMDLARRHYHTVFLSESDKQNKKR